MKKRFTLIAIWMTLCAYTQNIKEVVTKDQKSLIERIFTPDYIIESSKVISNSQDKDSVISARDIQIKELTQKIEALKKEHENTLIEIIKQNTIAMTAVKKVDSINDVQLKTERKKRFDWNITHLYSGVESREFNFKAIEINAEFMVELEKFHFGIKAFALPDPKGTYEAGAGIKLRYKFF